MGRNFETNPSIRPNPVLSGQRFRPLQYGRTWLSKFSNNQVGAIQSCFDSLISKADYRRLSVQAR